jgi:hypothetical protein
MHGLSDRRVRDPDTSDHGGADKSAIAEKPTAQEPS